MISKHVTPPVTALVPIVMKLCVTTLQRISVTLAFGTVMLALSVSAQFPIPQAAPYQGNQSSKTITLTIGGKTLTGVRDIFGVAPGTVRISHAAGLSDFTLNTLSLADKNALNDAQAQLGAPGQGVPGQQGGVSEADMRRAAISQFDPASMPAAPKPKKAALNHPVLPPPPVGETPQQAHQRYLALAEQGNVAAMTELGFCYFSGTGIPMDDAKAFQWMDKAASSGLPRALYGLGRCYELGCGVPADGAKAVKLYQQAADGDNIEALFYLGMCMLNGRGIEKNAELAAVLFLKGSNAGNGNCDWGLGHCHEHGWGVRQSFENAAMYYQLAINHGNNAPEMTKCQLGCFYRDGKGVRKNPQKAAELLTQAASAGDVQSMCELGWLYREHHEHQQSIEWFRKGAAAGHAESMDGLGYCYLAGLGAKADAARAITLFRSAAAKNLPAAQFHLGWCYSKGAGVSIDKATAIRLLEQSAKAGFQSAQVELDRITGKTPEPNLRQELFDAIMSIPSTGPTFDEEFWKEQDFRASGRWFR